MDEYSNWNDFRTDPDTTAIEPTVVNENGRAVQVLADGGEEFTILGAVTHPDEEVIPYANFGTDCAVYTDCQRNKWITVSDFYPGEDPCPDAAHAVVFLRVNDRIWDEKPNQTRIGSFVYGGNPVGDMTEEDCDSNSGGGVLQLTGDDVADSSKGKQQLYGFSLTEFPWNSGSHKYRLQIMEEERFHPLSLVWEHWWQAEVVDLTDSQTLGSSGWIGEWTLDNNWGIEEPELTDSKIAFGFGAVGTPFTGSVEVDFVGTTYWVY